MNTGHDAYQLVGVAAFADAMARKPTWGGLYAMKLILTNPLASSLGLNPSQLTTIQQATLSPNTDLSSAIVVTSPSLEAMRLVRNAVAPQQGETHLTPQAQRQIDASLSTRIDA